MTAVGPWAGRRPDAPPPVAALPARPLPTVPVLRRFFLAVCSPDPRAAQSARGLYLSGCRAQKRCKALARPAGKCPQRDRRVAIRRSPCTSVSRVSQAETRRARCPASRPLWRQDGTAAAFRLRKRGRSHSRGELCRRCRAAENRVSRPGHLATAGLRAGPSPPSCSHPLPETPGNGNGRRGSFAPPAVRDEPATSERPQCGLPAA